MRGKAGRGGRVFFTKARVIYLTILTFSFVFCLISGGRVAYSLLYACLLAPVLSLVHAYVLCLQIKPAYSLSVQTVIRGQDALYRFGLANKGPLPLPKAEARFSDNRGAAQDSRSSAFSLLPWQRAQMEKTITFPHRGVYLLKAEEIRLWGCFSLMSLCIHPDEVCRAVVFPRLVRISSFPCPHGFDTAMVTRFHKSRETSFNDTRKYAYGDPMSRIHWNLTARSGDLITKLYESEDEPEIFFLLDLRPVTAPGALDREDFLIELCLAAMALLLSQNRQIRLVYSQNERIFTLNGDSTNFFEAFYTAMAEAEFNASIAPAELIAACGGAKLCVAAVSGETDADFLNALPGFDRALIFAMQGDSARKPVVLDNARLVYVRPGEDIEVLLRDGI